MPISTLIAAVVVAVVFGYGSFFHETVFGVLNGTVVLTGKGWPDAQISIPPLWDAGFSGLNVVVWGITVASVVFLFEWLRRRRWRLNLRSLLVLFVGVALFHGLYPRVGHRAAQAVLALHWNDIPVRCVNAYLGGLCVLLTVLILLARTVKTIVRLARAAREWSDS